jgi:hypothetical protein
MCISDIYSLNITDDSGNSIGMLNINGVASIAGITKSFLFDNLPTKNSIVIIHKGAAKFMLTRLNLMLKRISGCVVESRSRNAKNNHIIVTDCVMA